MLAGDTAVGPHRKGPTDVAFARRWPEVTLHRGSPPPKQPVRRDLGPARGMDCLGEQCRLVIAALEEPGPMQRHRDEQIGAGEYIAAGTLHPLPERCSRMGMVAMLEPEQEAPAVVVVPQHGARLIPDRPLARAVPT